MQLTTRSDYAVRILLYLAAQVDRERWVTTAELAYALSISAHSLQKILLDLHHNDIIRTAAGRHGGVRLEWDLADITLSRVIAIGEKDSGWKFTACDRRPDCDCFLSGGNCTLRGVFRNVQENIMAMFDEISMASLRSPETDRAAVERARAFEASITPKS